MSNTKRSNVETMPNNAELTCKYPLHSIYFYPTESCNLKCIHCWIQPAHAADKDTYDAQNRDNVPVEAMERVVQEALPLGLCHIKFTGGEPFLNPLFFEYLERFSQYDLSFSIETNGTLLDNRAAKKLTTYNIRHISVSLDGSNAEIHESIRRVKGSFSQALHGIQSLTENNLYPQVIFCLQKRNAHDLEDTIRLARELKINSFEINPVVLTKDGALQNQRCESLAIEDLLHLEETIENHLTGKYPDMHIDLYIPPALKGMKELARHAFSTCNIFNICGILSNGDVSVCGIGRRKKELVMGNIAEESITRIWKEGRIFNEIRNKIPHQMSGICSRCLFKHHCLGFCRADALFSGQTLLDPNAFCESVHQKGMFPKSRILETESL